MPGTRVVGALFASVGIAAIAANEARAQAKYSFEIYGFGQADFIYDTNRMDPDWDDAFRPSKIPTTEGVFGSDGQTSISVKQSRFGVQGSLPVENLSPINFKFEFDLFGTGVDAGQTTFRLRHAYGEWGQFLAGQTNERVPQRRVRLAQPYLYAGEEHHVRRRSPVRQAHRQQRCVGRRLALPILRQVQLRGSDQSVMRTHPFSHRCCA